MMKQHPPKGWGNKRPIATTLLLGAALTLILPFVPINAQDGGSVHAQVTQSGGRARINVAGNLTILSQTVAAAVCMLDLGYDIEHEMELLHEAHDDFVRMLDALEHGDQSLGIPSPENRGSTIRHITDLRDHWAPMEQAASAILAGADTHENAVRVAQTNQDVLKHAELLFSDILNEYSDPFEVRMTDAIAISFAERQEMMAEKLKREACEIGGGHADAEITDDFAQTMSQFGATMTALHDGYEALGIRPPPNDSIKHHLEGAMAEWETTQPLLQAVLDNAGADEAGMIEIRKATEHLDHSMHAIVIEYLLAVPGANDMIVGPVTQYANDVLMAWVKDPAIVEAVQAHNLTSAAMSDDQLTAEDAEWVIEFANHAGPLIDKVAAEPTSVQLAAWQASTSDIVTEAIVMDLRGVVVGQSEPAPRYWHFEEERFREIARVRDAQIYISDVHMEHGGTIYQAEVSLPIKDPDTFEVIGVASFGVDVQSMF